MRNWSIDTARLQQNPERYAIWRMEQMVNFGLDGEMLDAGELKKYWLQLNIDPARRKFLSLLLHAS